MLFIAELKTEYLMQKKVNKSTDNSAHAAAPFQTLNHSATVTHGGLVESCLLIFQFNDRINDSS